MKSSILLTATLFLFSLSSFAQSPLIQWQKSLGGGSDDATSSMQQTSDGGYILMATSSSNNGDVSGNHGGEDIWVAKTDATGNITWQKSLGGSGTELAHQIRQTSDGGYIIAARSNSNNGDVSGNHGGVDGWVVKLNASGSIVWQKSLGNATLDAANAVQQTTDGGYIVAGHVDGGFVPGSHGVGTEAWLVKLDASGNVVWQKVYGGTQPDGFYAVQQTSDGGYIAAHATSSSDGDVTGYHGGGDLWVVKVNSIGTITWTKSLGGTGNESINGSGIQQTSDGGYILAGNTTSNNGDVSGNHGLMDGWAVKLNSSGSIVWQKALGGTDDEALLGVSIASDGGYILSGWTKSTNGDVSCIHGTNPDAWVLKLNSSGSLLWQKTYGGTNIDYGIYAQQTTDGDYALAGRSSSTDGDATSNHGGFDVWLVKLGGACSGAGCGCTCPLLGTPCNDGLFCTQNDVHDGNCNCAGTPVPVDDGIACTVDACDEGADQITHTPNNALCDDGNPNTTDVCHPTQGCQNNPNAPIPTLSEWGLIIFALLLLCTGAVAVWNSRYRRARVKV